MPKGGATDRPSRTATTEGLNGMKGQADISRVHIKPAFGWWLDNC